MLNNRFIISFIFSFFLVSSLFSTISKDYDFTNNKDKVIEQLKPNIISPYGYFNPTPPY